MRVNLPAAQIGAEPSLLTLGRGIAARSARTGLIRDQDQRTRLSTTGRTAALQMADQVERGRTIVPTVAQQLTLTDACMGQGSTRDRAARHMLAVVMTEQGLRGPHDPLPDGGGEVGCLDTGGSQRSRIVHGAAAAAAEPSADEKQSLSFHPTVALPAGRMRQAVAYICSDTVGWARSHVSPAVDERHVPIANLEVPVHTLRQSAWHVAAGSTSAGSTTATGPLIPTRGEPRSTARRLVMRATRSWPTTAGCEKRPMSAVAMRSCRRCRR